MILTVDPCCDSSSVGEHSKWLRRSIPTSGTIDELSPYFHDFGFRWLGTDVSSEFVLEDDPLDRETEIPGFTESESTATIDFVAEAIRLEAAGDLRSALHSIYQNAEQLMQFELFSELDSELVSSDLDSVNTDLLLGLLTATLPQKSRLPSRVKLFQETKRLLKKRGHYERGILSGLK